GSLGRGAAALEPASGALGAFPVGGGGRPRLRGRGGPLARDRSRAHYLPVRGRKGGGDGSSRLLGRRRLAPFGARRRAGWMEHRASSPGRSVFSSFTERATSGKSGVSAPRPTCPRRHPFLIRSGTSPNSRRDSA